MTNDRFTISITIKNSIHYIPLRPYTDQEYNSLPHLILTTDIE